MTYVELPMPEDVLPWRRREADQLRTSFRSDADLVDGVLRWRSNGRVVPSHCFRDAFCMPPAANGPTERVENDASLAEYARHVPVYSPETLAEMRSEYGEGAMVVDVLSGRRTRI